MRIFLVALLGIIVYGLYLLIEFAIPIGLIYLCFSHQDLVWLWGTLLIIWFIGRMILYMIKENK